MECINIYNSEDSAIGFSNTCPLESDLCSR